MSWRPHPKNAVADPHAGPWATCDSCRFIWNLPALSYQYQWGGFVLINQRLLKCPKCLDTPNEQLRSIVLPRDPDPYYEARPEQYNIDEGLIAAFTASIAPGTDPRFPDVQCIMNVTLVSSGVVSTGGALNGTNVAPGSVVGDQLSGPNPPGGLGTYAVTPKQTVSSTPMTTSGYSSSY
jgi:hypothetical protein